MQETRPFCFVIMPFAAELHYFYLYLRQHIEQTHGIECERADAHVLTVPLLEKINAYIERADVVIADCSGRNANVFYELGLAHAYDKKVILITKDAISEAPSDIRHFEFIKYDLGQHVEFLGKLDNALRNVFHDRYERLYQQALALFAEFRTTTPMGMRVVSREIFAQRVVEAEQAQSVPHPSDRRSMAEFLLPRIIVDAYSRAIMEEITRWFEKIHSDTSDNDSRQ